MKAYPSAELAVEAMKLGAADYLIRLVAPDDLERPIRETFLKGKVDIRRARAYFCSEIL